jgi:MGT family glycosyltransferase
MSPSRFLFTLWPFTGHLLPQVSIAVALRERGHEVAFYSGDAVRSIVEEEGFEFFGFVRVEEERAFRNMRAIETTGRSGRRRAGRLRPLLRDWLVETIPDQLADLRPVLADWRPDAIATDLSLWAPIVVLHESQPVPVALWSTFMGPSIPGPDAPPWGLGLRPPRGPMTQAAARMRTRLTELADTPLRRRVNDIRGEHGLPPLGESVSRYTARLPLYLVGNICKLDYDRRDLPFTVHYVGNCIWPPPRSPSASEWLARIPTNRPWVHVTEDLACGDPFLLRAAVEALGGGPIEVIMTTGPQRGPDILGPGPLPANVHVTDWLAHGDLLPRCSAVVTVGGKSTILAAMEAGVPLVVVPTTWDKPDNARRVTEAGAGVRLSPRRCTPEELRRAVYELLNESRYRMAAQEMAVRLEAAPGPAGAAELLEAVATPAARHSGRVRAEVHGAPTIVQVANGDGE